ncbi:hypothetical protein AMAG_04528 [Allomyces macrogynus ATCC 38327]|uniref:Uncharacterized protein n=1 Tax=Allomyces macrogynus (strain ATCC 38327) TaxID=578462 RepID=A0A0L0S5H2_ALLM3|nr:hypothetical protein AMAG_04528 [Allomyces macrogynus ATCC 38327]|eukprot:KNE57666.1 hypothetical protein AMAG_04528 [Allomyces macrogynus ATCC 38327]
MFPRSKGQTEKDLSDLNCSRVTIVRPGVLEFEEKRAGPTRYAESAFLTILPVVKYFAPTFSTPVGTVAKALIAAATDPAKWHGADQARIFDSKRLDAMANAAAPA